MWVAVMMGILIVGIIIVVFVTSRSENKGKLSRAERAELYSLRQLVIQLDDLAYSHRELDSVLAPQVIDEIRKTRRELQ